MITAILIIIFLIITFVGIVPRVFLQFNLNKINKLRHYPEEFKRKFHKYQFIQLLNHIKILLVVVFFLCIAVILLTSKVLKLEMSNSSLRGEVVGINEELDISRLNYQQLLEQLPIREYPVDGIGLEILFEKKISNTEEVQKFELDFSDKIYSYFGFVKPLVTYDKENKSLIINFIDSQMDEIRKQDVRINEEKLLDELFVHSMLDEVIINFNYENQLINQNRYKRNDDYNRFELTNNKEL
ncbi:hypothetical protein [Vagococcus zengguangii]|uniref:hypothetical protein n=1 Tax=Vagococcus zengguangii TaxID=2571750 RepID=UPI001107B044|nr:hypothetical protein [Vagococcus zengguangii]TLG79511.1 hypothetical protein FE258_08590 [Vagococcus zengguangii]